MKSDYHISVLLNEAIDGLNIKSNGIYLDCTLGRAGHSKEILKRIKEGFLVGIDQDDEALEFSKNELAKISNNYQVVKSNFKDLDKVLESLNIKKVDGILFDLGVSSPQFDEDYRGFSYSHDAKLDMRMDLNSSLTAEYIINNYSFEKLLKVFKEYGEDKYSYIIAKNICKERTKSPIKTTFELVDIIKKSKPMSELKKAGHPAKQIFQALRIEVNDEINVLKEALEKAINSLYLNGRIVVITFHSLEDKVVKEVFKKYSVIEGNRRNDYINPQDIITPSYKMINKKVITPSEEEVEKNHRSKSAKLRIIERIKL
ncbi:MAG: 16S rRNA (cytosine(1402)-N(4))-methyltransferase RsmH [Candidatus Onthovivens sp.]|nr:16S rRNA (cytosine(1402)-N(4))-methyltransferase RsmH [Candidatus Onthovivens sp.]